MEQSSGMVEGIDLPENQKASIERQNAIRLFKLPLE